MTLGSFQPSARGKLGTLFARASQDVMFSYPRSGQKKYSRRSRWRTASGFSSTSSAGRRIASRSCGTGRRSGGRAVLTSARRKPARIANPIQNARIPHPDRKTCRLPALILWLCDGFDWRSSWRPSPPAVVLPRRPRLAHSHRSRPGPWPQLQASVSMGRRRSGPRPMGWDSTLRPPLAQMGRRPT
jgi:hypothetical protein